MVDIAALRLLLEAGATTNRTLLRMRSPISRSGGSTTRLSLSAKTDRAWAARPILRHLDALDLSSQSLVQLLDPSRRQSRFFAHDQALVARMVVQRQQIRVLRNPREMLGGFSKIGSST